LFIVVETVLLSFSQVHFYQINRLLSASETER
jgi:hypothetical protein